MGQRADRRLIKRVLTMYRDLILESNTLTDDQGRPDRSTLLEPALKDVREIENALEALERL